MRGIKRKYLYILVAVTAAFCIGAVYPQPEQQYRRMQGIDSDELLRRGEEWLQKDAGADSALVCFSLVASRYSPDMKRADKEKAVKANLGKWLVYFSHLFDYPKAYESLLAAIEICDEEGLDKSRIEVSMGGLLHVMADQSESAELYRKAAENYASAFSHAVTAHNYAVADIAFVNLLTIHRTLGTMDSMKDIYNEYSAIPCGATDYRRKFARSLYNAGASISPDGSKILESLPILPDKPEYYRLRYIGLKTAAEAFSHSGNLNKAIETASEAREYARRHKIRDGEMEATMLLSGLYKAQGNAEMSLSERDSFLRQKERMLGSKQIQRLDELRFLADIRKADEQLNLMKEEKRRQNIVIGFLAALILCIGTLLWVFFYKNAKLRKAYSSIYRQFQSNLAAEERERNLRMQLRQKALEEQESSPAEKKAATPTDAHQAQKYSSSRLGEDERNRIIESLNETLATTGFVYSQECTIGRLADMIGCNTKYLSQIINEVHECNFNTFINEYRVKEASRRIAAGGEWDKLTIEAIANSVGFKSRSTFFSFFKQFTGMTPAEYRRHIAAKKQQASVE